MEELLEDYKRRLATINDMLNGLPQNEDTVDTHKRYITKASCYRTFISEIEKLIEKENNNTKNY